MKRSPEEEAALAKFRNPKGTPETKAGVGTDPEHTRRRLKRPVRLREASLPTDGMGRLVISYEGVGDDGEPVDAPKIRIIEARYEAPTGRKKL